MVEGEGEGRGKEEGVWRGVEEGEEGEGRGKEGGGARGVPPLRYPLHPLLSSSSVGGREEGRAVGRAEG